MEGVYVIRFDHRDVGYSKHRQADYDLFTLLHDGLAILDAYQILATNLVGHSRGGYFVALAAVHRAHSVRSATMISAGATVTPDVAETLGLSLARPET
jgi:pimeloyl-ACP methyl ester carboxylesterase